ncbi:VIT domain-containing protein, partial [Tahibacter sp.]|uniref:VIT domain-containing protein n=1 Tax=Tahibacter sp. TaxID=2056211 RepID=UPI0028C4C31B
MNTLWKGLAVATFLLADAASALSVERTPPTRPPQVWLDPSLQLQPIQLQDVAIDIRIQGFIASTRLDLTFHNPNARVLEGEFVFPLAEGQSITGYALDVEGKLRQGVVVEKETARVAYESTVRHGIDPGLAELTQGNVFRTRLYPLPANGTKRVQITFDQPLIDAGGEYRYLLPLQFTQAVKRFTVHAEALRTEHAPANTGTGALSFERWQGGFAADLERTDFLPERELAFSLPKPADTASIFSIADRHDTQWRRFAAQVQSAPEANLKPAAAPRRVALYYDASGSAAPRERTRELDFLAAWIAQLREVDIDLIVFRNEADAAQRFTIRDGDMRALRSAIEALPLDGASAYGALRVDATAHYDLVLVVGDGLSNFGSGEPQWRDGGTSRLAFLHAAQTVDHARLTRWAKRYGGQVINLLALDDASALNQLARTQWALQATRVLRGRCEDLAPSAPQPAGSVFSLYGRCSTDAELQLEFGDGTGNTLRRTLIPAAGEPLDAARGAFIDRLWATARIADLENADTRDRNAIVELSTKYGVVTQDTSMLVLDRIEDYVRYKVEPREPDLAAAYRRMLAAQAPPVSEQGQRDSHRGATMVLWQSFRNWHLDTPHAWLETLLPPAADAEVVRWEALPTLRDSKQHLSEARALEREANVLRKRWAADKADPARRAAWEREATGLMLRLDSLRQLRLAQAPDSDEIKRKPQQIADERGGESVRRVGMSPPAAAASARERRSADAVPVIVEEPSPLSMAAPAPAATLRESADADKGAPAVDGALPSGSYRTVSNDAASMPSAEVGIQLRDWDPNTPYLARLRAAPDAYAAYLQERREQAATPAFFLDCADYFRNEAKDPRLALRVLS